MWQEKGSAQESYHDFPSLLRYLHAAVAEDESCRANLQGNTDENERGGGSDDLGSQRLSDIFKGRILLFVYIFSCLSRRF